MRRILYVFAAAAIFAASTAVQADTVLTGLDYQQSANGSLEVDLDFDGPVPEVRGYRLDHPARLTIDLIDTGSRLEWRHRSIDTAGVRQLTALKAGQRARLIFELDSALAYNTIDMGHRLRLVIGGNMTEQAFSSAPVLENIDFRRGENGAGRVLVTFDRDGVDARVSETGRSDIVARLDGVILPAALSQVYDVTDFATPLSRITPHSSSSGVTLEIQGNGDYEMVSKQSGRQLIIEAQPRASAAPDETEAFPYTGKRITLNFQDIEVRAVLAIIAEFTGLNLVASESVVGRVTLNLEEVPWDQALDLVLKSHGLASRQKGNVIVVAPAAELAQIELQELETREQLQTLSPLRTEYIQVKYAKAEELAQLVRAEGGFGLLSERGRVAVDVRTNTLLVQDTAGQVESIVQALNHLDVAVRQVQIEARIVIARDNATRELGIDWGMSGNGPIKGVLDGGGGDRLSFSGATDGAASHGGLSVDLGNAVNPSSMLSFGYLSGDILLDLELRALESEGKSETISQPRVITANQRTATIKQGTEIPYQEASSSGATSTSFKEAVLSLEVTPQITPDNRIIMNLAINNDTVADQSFDGAPAIDTNKIETQVLVDDGATVVLGGILTTEQVHSLFKTPLLGDIPVLGNLFRYTESSNDKVELLVFITPKILDDNVAVR